MRGKNIMIDIDWGRNMYDWQGEKFEKSLCLVVSRDLRFTKAQRCFPKMLRNVYTHELRGSIITS
jgi:hypothetical protein